MKATGTLTLLKEQGIAFSHNRPRVSNDNPYSESLFKTLKYMGRYPGGGFESINTADSGRTISPPATTETTCTVASTT